MQFKLQIIAILPSGKHLLRIYSAVMFNFKQENLFHAHEMKLHQQCFLLFKTIVQKVDEIYENNTRYFNTFIKTMIGFTQLTIISAAINPFSFQLRR